jgi:hypothetical protein
MKRRIRVRLDLAAGGPTEVANDCAAVPSIPAVDFSICPSDRYFVYVPQKGPGQRSMVAPATGP